MKHSKMILEACVDSPESAEAAERGGADRLELCGHLIIGGVRQMNGCTVVSGNIPVFLHGC